MNNASYKLKGWPETRGHHPQVPGQGNCGGEDQRPTAGKRGGVGVPDKGNWYPTGKQEVPGERDNGEENQLLQ